jgi:hypothetical protein
MATMGMEKAMPQSIVSTFVFFSFRAFAHVSILSWSTAHPHSFLFDQYSS